MKYSMSSLMVSIFSATHTNEHESNSPDIKHLWDWAQFFATMTFIVIAVFISGRSYQLYVTHNHNLHNFYLNMRNPICSIWFMSVSFFFCIYLGLLSANIISFSMTISIIFQSLFISCVIYVLYILYFAIFYQHQVINQVNQNGILQRYIYTISSLAIKTKYKYETICSIIMVLHNLIICIITELLHKTGINDIWRYFIVITPQILSLNIMIFMMKRMIPSNFQDLYDVKVQWKHIIRKLQWKLNLQLFLIYLFPSYFILIMVVGNMYFLPKYVYLISGYPIQLCYLKMQELLNIETPATWQEFLVCNPHKEQEEIAQAFQNEDDLDRIFTDIGDRFSRINETRVVTEKVELFLRWIAEDPKENPDSCLHELLFVLEIMQIKQVIATRINNGKFTSNFGKIVKIPIGLPESPIAKSFGKVSFMNGVSLYETFQDIYNRYCYPEEEEEIDNNPEMQRIPLYHLEDVSKIHAVYDRLEAFHKTLCPNNNNPNDFESAMATFSRSIEAQIGLELGDELEFDFGNMDNMDNMDSKNDEENAVDDDNKINSDVAINIDLNINMEMNIDNMDTNNNKSNNNETDNNEMNHSQMSIIDGWGNMFQQFNGNDDNDDNDDNDNDDINSHNDALSNLFNNNNVEQTQKTMKQKTDCNNKSEETITEITGEPDNDDRNKSGYIMLHNMEKQEEESNHIMVEMEEIQHTFNSINMSHYGQEEEKKSQPEKPRPSGEEIQEIQTTFNSINNSIPSLFMSQDVLGIYEIIDCYDDILMEMNQKVQNCYNSYSNNFIESRLKVKYIPK